MPALDGSRQSRDKQPGKMIDAILRSFLCKAVLGLGFLGLTGLKIGLLGSIGLIGFVIGLIIGFTECIGLIGLIGIIIGSILGLIGLIWLMACRVQGLGFQRVQSRDLIGLCCFLVLNMLLRLRS